jgi:hypothetical protein
MSWVRIPPVALHCLIVKVRCCLSLLPLASEGFQMKKLNQYNAFGQVMITSKYVGVTMFAFTDDGFMHKVANKFKIFPELPIKDKPVMPFAAEIKSGNEPQFIFSFVKEPDNAKSLVDEAQVVDSMYTVAYELMERVGFEKPEEEITS